MPNMDAANLEDLKTAYRREKDPRVIKRMAAVNMVCIRGKGVRDTAEDLTKCPSWVSFWVGRFEEGGIDALRDLPRSGRRPKAQLKRIEKILQYDNNGITAPKKLCCHIRNKLRVTYHMTPVRRILMNRLDMSAKTPQLVRTNKADEEGIRAWQLYAKRRISRLKRDGFLTVMQDEAFFIHDPAAGKKYRSPKGEPIVMQYNGRHSKAVAYGATAADGRRLFRTCDRFDGDMFLEYLKELRRHFGKVNVIMDNASQHSTNDVNDFLAKNKDGIRVMHLPVATPELGAIEEYWHQSKRDVLVSEYYATFEEMRRAVSEYTRTSGPRLDIMKYIGRKSLVFRNF